VQEALTNVLRHAGVQQATVRAMQAARESVSRRLALA